MFFDDLLADGQTQSRSLSDLLRREEGIKDPLLRFLCDSNPCVGDRNFHPSSIFSRGGWGGLKLGGNAQVSSLGHGIEGIGDEVEEEGLKMGRISQDGRNLGRERGEERHIPCMAPRKT